MNKKWIVWDGLELFVVMDSEQEARKMAESWIGTCDEVHVLCTVAVCKKKGFEWEEAPPVKVTVEYEPVVAIEYEPVEPVVTPPWVIRPGKIHPLSDMWQHGPRLTMESQ